MLKKSLLALLFLFPLLLSAQIGIKMELNRRDYMLYEPIYICVTLRNDSGRALLFGKDPRLQGFILFDIRDKNNRRIPKRPNTEISVSGLFLGPGETRSITFPLHLYYDLDRTGTFQVQVYVSHNLLDNEYQSQSMTFIRIHNGIQTWSTTVGIPDLTGEKNAPAESRTYSIRALDVQGERLYYLVVEDQKKVYGVTHVGYQFGQNKVQAMTDMLSRIHLLVPMSHKVSHYLTFGLDGTNLESSYWKKGSTIPALYRDQKSGKVSRIGGVPARPGVDFKTSDFNRLTTREINRQHFATPDAPLKNSGIVDLGKSLGK